MRRSGSASKPNEICDTIAPPSVFKRMKPGCRLKPGLVVATVTGAVLLAGWNVLSSVVKITSASRTASPHPVPGGLALRGECNLRALREQGAAVDIGMFVKHGLHSSKLVPKSCRRTPRSTAAGVRVVSFTPGQKKNGTSGKAVKKTALARIDRFVDGGARKILPVRSQASFYKSIFNHVCNSNQKLKRAWREHNRVDCTREGELFRLLSLNEVELQFASSPFLLKDIILRSPKVDNVMLIDYTCLPSVVNALCDEPMPSYENMTGKETNGAAHLNYTDYWAMHNHAPFLPFNPFWDEIYERLKGVCCLEFERLN